MNEKIKELALKADISRIKMANALVPSGFVYFHTEETLKKFAELILWELIDKISQEQDIAEQNWQCKNGVHICHKLTEHFGVEE